MLVALLLWTHQVSPNNSVVKTAEGAGGGSRPGDAAFWAHLDALKGNSSCPLRGSR